MRYAKIEGVRRVRHVGMIQPHRLNLRSMMPRQTDVICYKRQDHMRAQFPQPANRHDRVRQ